MITAAAAILLAMNLHGAVPADAELIAGQKILVKTLYEKKMYFDCAAETGRLIEFDPDPARLPRYNYFIMLNYYRGNQFKTVSYLASSASSAGYNGSDLAVSLIHAYSILKAGYPADALTPLAGFDYKTAAPEFKAELLNRRVDLMLYNSDYSGALKEIEAAEPYLPGGSVFNFKKALASRSELNLKSPLLASIMTGLIPGSGQAYNGSISAALLTVLSVALPSAAAWWAFNSGRDQIGYAAAGFGAVFYAGGIYGAWNGASRYNDVALEKFSRRIRSEYTGNYDPEKYSGTGALLK